MNANLAAVALKNLESAAGSPRLTWYDVNGERVELSGHVLANWIIKTTNLLTEEFEIAPGQSALIDLPAHWRGLVWALATWRAGGEAVFLKDGFLPDDDSGPASTSGVRVIITTRPEVWTGRTRAEVVAVSLPALSRTFAGELPRGAIDASSAVMTYSDALGFVSPMDAHATALSMVDGDPTGVTFAELTSALAALAGWSFDGGRDVVRHRPEQAIHLLATSVSAWLAGGSVVLVPDAPEYDDARVAYLATTEGATVRS